MSSEQKLIDQFAAVLSDAAVKKSRKREYQKLRTRARRIAQDQSAPHAGRPRVTDYAAIRAMKATGKTILEILDETGIGEATVYRALREMQKKQK